ncbi:hypothetical protein PoB_003174200 [Plakobranchus ocellatus]|uniref:Uncharacterized protein n=1 Tax=Plakobranchus ocellatus TaxID=259542 RepID=A0AAV4AE14_9GAST|nr:hypothetical protein PoB_003174200 [Plakobranchus ocellatus]
MDSPCPLGSQWEPLLYLTTGADGLHHGLSTPRRTKIRVVRSHYENLGAHVTAVLNIFQGPTGPFRKTFSSLTPTNRQHKRNVPDKRET